MRYGADAVYLAGKSFGMRSAPANFGPEELAQAVDFCHQRGVKVYVTCNTLPRNQEFEELPGFLTACQEAGVDAFIISDLGVLALAGKVAPQVERHISTQTGIVNFAAAQVCWELGAKRVVLAREVPGCQPGRVRPALPLGVPFGGGSAPRGGVHSGAGGKGSLLLQLQRFADD